MAEPETPTAMVLSPIVALELAVAVKEAVEVVAPDATTTEFGLNVTLLTVGVRVMEAPRACVLSEILTADEA